MLKMSVHDSWQFSVSLLWCWPIVINVSGCSTCWIWSLPRCTSASAVNHTTAWLTYELITVTDCRKHSVFHCHSSLLGQVQSRTGPGFLWIVLTLLPMSALPPAWVISIRSFYQGWLGCWQSCYMPPATASAETCHIFKRTQASPLYLPENLFSQHAHRKLTWHAGSSGSRTHAAELASQARCTAAQHISPLSHEGWSVSIQIGQGSAKWWLISLFLRCCMTASLW